MIKTFKCKDTETLFSGRRVARFANIERVVLRKLVQLDLAQVIEDMSAPPGNGVCASTTNGVSVSALRMVMLWMSKSLTTTNRRK
jgi:proteic killer suppression protein